MTTAKAGARQSTKDDDRVVVDLNDLTCGEIELFEETTGQPIAHYFADGVPQGKALRALGWIFKRRTAPGFTFEDAGNLRVGIKAATPIPLPAKSA